MERWASILDNCSHLAKHCMRFNAGNGAPTSRRNLFSNRRTGDMMSEALVVSFKGSCLYIILIHVAKEVFCWNPQPVTNDILFNIKPSCSWNTVCETLKEMRVQKEHKMLRISWCFLLSLLSLSFLDSIEHDFIDSIEHDFIRIWKSETVSTCLHSSLDQHQTYKPVIVSVVSSNPTGGNFIF